MSSEPGRELLLLGILRRSPQSAYSLDRIVRDHAPLYRPFKYGNVYHAVSQMADEGLLLSKIAKSRRGPQDTKAVFRLSAAGERRFHALLKQILLDVQSPDPTLEVAYVLLGQLPRNEALNLVRERLTQVSEQERRLSRLVGDVESRSRGGYLGLSHTAHRLRAEQAFLRKSIALLEDAKWNPDWVGDDALTIAPSRKASTR